jgi:hypothetical protein
MRGKRVCGVRDHLTDIFAVAVLLIFGMCMRAGAFEIKTGIPDLEVRWDNTIRYVLGVRAVGQDPNIIANPNLDDGDRNFKKGVVTNRIDDLSELDLKYKGDYGFRVSGDLWYDQRYHNGLYNESVATSNHLVDGRQALGLSDYTKRLFGGPDGELLDAFVFGKFKLGQVPLNAKAGRHTIYWGESMLLEGAINGISYCQMPIDAAKGFATPGVEAKELFRPLNNISFQAQLLNNLSIEAQYFMEWESWRLPESGSYLNNADVLLHGADSLVLAPGVVMPHGKDIEPDGINNFGLAMHWSPDFLGGVVGLYYRHLDDMLPQAVLDLGTGKYFLTYGKDVDLYGVSLSTSIHGISVGAELSYRHNMPLVSEAAVLMPGSQVPGDTLGARGNTWHGLINFLGIVKQPPLFDTATWIAEFTWAHCGDVTQNDNLYLGRDGYSNIDHVTDNSVGFAANFTPTWFHVFPGMDLSAPLSFLMGIQGNSPITFGDNFKAGTWSAGLSLDIYEKYTVTLQYIGFFGDYHTTGGAVDFARGAESTLRDRDYVALTFKTSF